MSRGLYCESGENVPIDRGELVIGVPFECWSPTKYFSRTLYLNISYSLARIEEEGDNQRVA